MSLAAMFRLQKPEIIQYDVAAWALLCNSAVEINWFRLVSSLACSLHTVSVLR